ncbi:MAG TPA: EAL domain-containing protein [Haloplasmataceae bacterium]
MKNWWNKFIDTILFPKKSYASTHITIIALFMFGVYMFVYFTGGTKYVYSHTMYIPIILAAISFGSVGGLIASIIAGIIIGPLMPMDTTTYEKQLFFNWFYRLIVFIFVGAITGYSFDVFRKNNKKIIDLIINNQETNIPNLTIINHQIYFKDNYFLKDAKYVFSFIINNYKQIIDLFSRNHYINLLKDIYREFKKIFPNDTQIFQIEVNKLWICLCSDDYELYLNQMLHSMNKTFMINNIPIYLETAIGIVKHETGNDIIEDFKHADTTSLYAQKYNQQYLIYEAKYSNNSKNLELLGMFYEALNHDLLEVYFQPKVSLDTEKPISMEALLRWYNKEKGYISPLEIIPLIEGTYLINPLTEWVVKRSINLIQELRKFGINISISVNVSSKNLQQDDFFDKIMMIVNENDIEPSSIELELTESAIMENPEANTILLQKFCDNQIKLSIDDYGTGYSSLSYLIHLPFKYVKIDKYFIRNMNHDDNIKLIVQSTIDLIHKLGMKVVAEGVETEDTVSLLKEMQCDIAQGFYYAKPMNKADIIHWLKENYNEN